MLNVNIAKQFDFSAYFCGGLWLVEHIVEFLFPSHYNYIISFWGKTTVYNLPIVGESIPLWANTCFMNINNKISIGSAKRHFFLYPNSLFQMCFYIEILQSEQPCFTDINWKNVSLKLDLAMHHVLQID